MVVAGRGRFIPKWVQVKSYMDCLLLAVGHDRFKKTYL